MLSAMTTATLMARAMATMQGAAAGRVKAARRSRSRTPTTAAAAWVVVVVAKVTAREKESREVASSLHLMILARHSLPS